MKAERRHELHTNTLAQVLNDLPIYARIHANKILIGIIVICLLVLLLRYRMNATEQARQGSRDALMSARLGIDQLRDVQRRLTMEPVERVKGFKTLAIQVNGAVDQVMAGTGDDDVTLRAEAYVALGDLNWALANTPPMPGAATQPALVMPKTSSQYLDAAEIAYLKVVKDYASQPTSKVTALMGLAAIAENRHEWERASENYAKIIDDPSAAAAYKLIAKQRQQMLAQLRTPVYLGSFSSTQPTTAEATTEPTGVPWALPATLPATQPSAAAAPPATNPQ